jgi:hypothetical protein
MTRRSLFASFSRYGTRAAGKRFPASAPSPPNKRRNKYLARESAMPRGDKSSYSGKQKRMAEHIEEGYESRGVGEKEAERRAWATVNKETHGGKKSGSGRGKKNSYAASRKGGRLGGSASAKRPAAARSASARKAAGTRKRRAAH